MNRRIARVGSLRSSASDATCTQAVRHNVTIVLSAIE